MNNLIDSPNPILIIDLRILRAVLGNIVLNLR
jgi:hypothetical protein